MTVPDPKPRGFLGSWLSVALVCYGAAAFALLVLVLRVASGGSWPLSVVDMGGLLVCMVLGDEAMRRSKLEGW